MWGLFPLYFRVVRAFAPLEILAQRMVWSAAVLGIVLAVRRQWHWSGTALKAAVLKSFLASAALLSINWFVYIWAVDAGRVIDASLGYFINPLVSVLLGVVLLRERLRSVQWLSIALAALGVGWLTFAGGHLPWIGLMLAASFGSYGFLRKTAELGALEGLTLETLLLLPLSSGYLAWLAAHGQSHFGGAPWTLRSLVALSGPLTVVPLLCFAAGARKIPLSLLGLLQYVAPTLQFLLGVFAFHEPFDGRRLAGYALIWLALAVYAVEGFAVRRLRATEH